MSLNQDRLLTLVSTDTGKEWRSKLIITVCNISEEKGDHITVRYNVLLPTKTVGPPLLIDVIYSKGHFVTTYTVDSFFIEE